MLVFQSLHHLSYCLGPQKNPLPSAKDEDYNADYKDESGLIPLIGQSRLHRAPPEGSCRVWPWFKPSSSRGPGRSHFWHQENSSQAVQAEQYLAWGVIQTSPRQEQSGFKHLCWLQTPVQPAELKMLDMMGAAERCYTEQTGLLHEILRYIQVCLNSIVSVIVQDLTACTRTHCCVIRQDKGDISDARLYHENFSMKTWNFCGKPTSPYWEAKQGQCTCMLSRAGFSKPFL